MSNVYILEPPTSGKVLMETTVGDIDVELWAKETPKTCRNFIQLCLEGYYNNTIFHRVVKDFIVQGGDPKGDGTGGESIYGEPFKDEFHQRLRFARRGLLAMANSGKDDNASQFFFTLGPTPELQNKHTIFGKITGDTIFNMLKLTEGLIEDERPLYPHKILKIEVLNNPFPDIEPRIIENKVKEKKKKEKKAGVKNFKLLSFGAEAEEDEEESSKFSEQFTGKGKSTHDILDDPKLSSKTEETPSENKGNSEETGEDNEDNDDDDDEAEEIVDPGKQLENIRQKLKRKHKKSSAVEQATTSKTAETLDTYESILEEERQEKKRKKYEEIKQQIDNVKKEYHKNKLKKDIETQEEKKREEINETLQEYKDEYGKYKSKTAALPKKGAGREQFTLQLLERFRKKLECAKQNNRNEEDEEVEDKDRSINERGKDKDEEKEEEEILDEDDAWMVHRLSFQEKTPTLAKDANKKDDDWFEIYDPRSTLNKRRRGEDAQKFVKK